MEPSEIRAALDRLLPGIERPARYLGLEANCVRKSWDDVAVRLLLAFPDEYGIGMSHHGTRLLYHIANRRDDTLAERAYAPWPDMAAAMRAVGVPLYSLESFRPAAAFDIVGITLQSELNYVNVPYLLDLAGFPRWAAERDETWPLVVAGGPCTANPEPVADFFDVVAVGDGEVLLPVLLDAVKTAGVEGLPRIELLRRLAGMQGFYVPRFYRWHPGPEPASGGRFEVVDPAATFPVSRAFAPSLEVADTPTAPLVPAVEVVQDRLGVEVVRGCTRGCRFCQAGFWYRPVREQDPAGVASLLEAQVDATGYHEVGLLSLSTADYTQVRPLADRLVATLSERRVGISLPSLRADAFSLSLAEAVSRVRKSGFTFAPETGSDRLRRVLNKSLTNADMMAAAETAFGHGWQLIKLYAMIGLPTETDADLEALVELTRQLLAAARRVGNRHAEVKVAVAPFVPKAFTPFQWEPYIPLPEARRKQELLRESFRTLRGARLTWGKAEAGRLEALLARGDRRLARVVARAHDLGAVLDGWDEWLRLDAWEQAAGELGVDIDAEVGPRDGDAFLPWEVIDPGVTRRFLEAERRRALAGQLTPDCRTGPCFRCGVAGDGAEVRLATATLETADLAGQAPSNGSLVQPERSARARLTFSKTGGARFLSHRNVMDLLERALRAAAAPVRYTEGFNPHIRISMGPATSTGMAALAEPCEVDCHDAFTTEMLERANRALPQGLRLSSVTMVPAGGPGLGKLVRAVRVRLAALPEIAPFPTSLEAAVASAPALAGLAAGILEWRRDSSDLVLTLNARQKDGPTPAVKELLAAMGVADGLVRLVPVCREEVLLDAPPDPS